jgi:hypothetical protein
VRQTWREAHRIAQITATHAHHDLGVNRGGYVDVFQAIRMTDVPMRLEHMPNLFGIYICPASDGPGILLNSGLSLSALRHTAAHELGHHRFGHGDSVDRYLDPWYGQAPGGWSGPEMSAEAFAAWFLMPRPAVLAGLATLALHRPRTAEDVYRLATLLGVSFRGLARHLVTLRLADAADAQTWARTGRGQLRRRLAGAAADLCRGEVHLLRPEMGDLSIHAGADDLLVLPVATPAQDLVLNLAAGLEPISPTGGAQMQGRKPDHTAAPKCWRVTPNLTAPTTLGVPAGPGAARDWAICVEPVRVREGIDLDWLEAHQDHYPDEDPTPW